MIVSGLKIGLCLDGIQDRFGIKKVRYHLTWDLNIQFARAKSYLSIPNEEFHSRMAKRYITSSSMMRVLYILLYCSNALLYCSTAHQAFGSRGVLKK